MAGEVTNESLLATLAAIQTKRSDIAEEIAGLKALADAAPARRRSRRDKRGGRTRRDGGACRALLQTGRLGVLRSPGREQ